MSAEETGIMELSGSALQELVEQITSKLKRSKNQLLKEDLIYYFKRNSYPINNQKNYFDIQLELTDKLWAAYNFYNIINFLTIPVYNNNSSEEDSLGANTLTYQFIENEPRKFQPFFMYTTGQGIDQINNILGSRLVLILFKKSKNPEASKQLFNEVNHLRDERINIRDTIINTIEYKALEASLLKNPKQTYNVPELMRLYRLEEFAMNKQIGLLYKRTKNIYSIASSVCNLLKDSLQDI